MTARRPGPRRLAVAIAAAVTITLASAAPAAHAEPAAGAIRAGSLAVGYKGPSGNTVDGYCQRHLPDDTPRAARLPNRALDCQLQWTAARFGYSGPIDGSLGSASWRGAQRYLDSVGTFHGTISGRLDAETARAIQRKAAQAPGRFRYTGRIGGSVSVQAWRGFAYFLALPWSG